MWLFVCAAVCFMLAAPGCRSTHYYAANLPYELEAPPVENPLTVDLSNLAMPAADADLIAVGDILEVSISAGLTANDTVDWMVRVDNNGLVTLPEIGALRLAGMDPETAESVIKTECMQAQLFRNPHVTLARKQQQKNRVLVLGAVETQGWIELPRHRSDLVSALVAAGGLAEDAGTQVEIRNPPSTGLPRPNGDAVAKVSAEAVDLAGHALSGVRQPSSQSIHVDLISATESAGEGYLVEDGSIVMVERRDPLPFHVIGLVNQPGTFEFPVGKELRLLDAIAHAKWTSSSLADRVYIIRRYPDNEPRVIQASLSAAKTDGVSNLRLAPGDTVSVEQTPATVALDTLKILRFGIGASLGTVF